MNSKISKKTNKNGFIAIISVIIASLILLTLTIALSQSNYYGRFNILDSEFKEVSRGLAEACIEAVKLKHGANGSYVGGEEIVVKQGQNCFVRKVEQSGAYITVRVQGIYQNSYTNLETVLNPSSNPKYGFVTVKECRALEAPYTTCN